jgi:chorismate mutase
MKIELDTTSLSKRITEIQEIITAKQRANEKVLEVKAQVQQLIERATELEEQLDTAPKDFSERVLSGDIDLEKLDDDLVDDSGAKISDTLDTTRRKIKILQDLESDLRDRASTLQGKERVLNELIHEDRREILKSICAHYLFNAKWGDESAALLLALSNTTGVDLAMRLSREGLITSEANEALERAKAQLLEEAGVAELFGKCAAAA